MGSARAGGGAASPDRDVDPRGHPGRAALAEPRGALIVEDDYDAEYRYDRAPIGAMQGVAPARVVYAGTASKTLAPGLRLGWLVAPAHVVDAIAEAKALADRGSPVLDRWPSRTSSSAARSIATCAACDRATAAATRWWTRCGNACPDLEPAGIAAGLHLVAYLPDDLDETTLVEAAARRDVALYGLAPYRISHTGRPGLIFGASEAPDGLDVLALDVDGPDRACARPSTSPSFSSSRVRSVWFGAAQRRAGTVRGGPRRRLDRLSAG